MLPARISSDTYGHTPNGEAVHLWKLTGASGLSLECLNYGGIITALKVPIPQQDRAVNVVLSLPSLSAYLSDQSYMGAMVGRVAGRVRDAKLNVCGREVCFTANEGSNHLHGGAHALSRTVWRVTPRGTLRHPELELFYRSPAGEEGYPGSVDIRVVYGLTEDNALSIATISETGETTPLSLTNHSYFNLSGGAAPTIEEHVLSIVSGTFYPTDASGVLLHTELSLNGRVEDLRVSARLADVLPHLPRNHGEAYALLGGDQPTLAAILSYTQSQGRTLSMRCSTTQTCLQTYAASAFTGQPHPRHAGLCLECQGLPNLTDSSAPGNILVHPGKPQKHVTTYQFVWE